MRKYKKTLALCLAALLALEFSGGGGGLGSKKNPWHTQLWLVHPPKGKW